ncbi:hypothetical protein SAMN05216428_11411 [Nitrosospira sp. Nsp11]|nr:hypothetical protein SAMN05216428_11411 [Nitrosospira sp. Nsp11]
MHYLLIIVAFLAVACSVPPGAFKPDPSPIEVAVDEPRQEIKERGKPEVKPEPKPRAVIKTPTCKGIDTGDEKESFNLKLDCMLDGK